MAGCRTRSARSFNPDTMRMEVTDFMAVIFNPVAQAKFVHTVSAGYVTGSVFVLAISALFLLQKQHRDLAIRSMVVAASFGLASALSVVVLGDECGYVATEHQKMKIAAMEAMYETEPAPAGLTLFAIPGADGRPAFQVQFPFVLGLITTRSLDRDLPGITELTERAARPHRQRHRRLQGAAGDPSGPTNDAGARATFDAHKADLGYALLLKKYRPDIENATGEEITKAALDTVPDVWPLFWSFRLMVGIGFFYIAFFAFWFWKASTPPARKQPLLAQGRSSGRCRCPGSPSKSAGSSPNTAASPGWSKACCRPSTRRRACTCGISRSR